MAASPTPTGVHRPVIRREERRRRVLLAAIVAALLLGITPVIGHHVLGAVDWMSADQQHLAIICLVALHLLLAPLHALSHWLLYAGVLYGLIERGMALWRHRTVMRALPMVSVGPDTKLASAVSATGMQLEQVRTVVALPVPAFTTGWITPRVVVAADLSQTLDDDELRAVLAHEAVHLRRRDPLRLFLLRALAAVLFWLPVLRRLTADLEDEVEITADDVVAQHLALPLASAILKLGAGKPRVAETVGFQRADLLPRRVRRLAGEDAFATTHTSTGSLVAAGTALLLVWSSGLMVLHPLVPPHAHEGTRPAHCNHEGASPFTHLFCRGLTLRSDAVLPCPHLLAATP